MQKVSPSSPYAQDAPTGRGGKGRGPSAMIPTFVAMCLQLSEPLLGDNLDWFAAAGTTCKQFGARLLARKVDARLLARMGLGHRKDTKVRPIHPLASMWQAESPEVVGKMYVAG